MTFTSPFPVGTFLQLLPHEPARFFNVRRHIVDVQVVAILPDVPIVSGRKRCPDRAASERVHSGCDRSLLLPGVLLVSSGEGA